MNNKAKKETHHHICINCNQCSWIYFSTLLFFVATKHRGTSNRTFEEIYGIKPRSDKSLKILRNRIGIVAEFG